MAIYDEIGAHYDLIYPETAKRVPFVRDTLRAAGANAVLELGTGTGLYLKPLKDAGFDAVGIDISAAMLAAARAKDPELQLHEQDATGFTLDRRFDAILALSSFLVVLDTEEAFRRCLARCAEHLVPGGHLLAEMPNHEVEIAELNHRQETVSNPDQTFTAVIQYSRTATHWTEAWHLFEAADGAFRNRTVHCSERLYDVAKTQEIFRTMGFTLVGTWGDLRGAPHDPASSPRHVWLWRKA